MFPDAVDTWIPCTRPASAAAISRAIAMPSAAARVRPVGPPHPLDERLGHPHAGHFVGHELGVPRALERKDRRRRRAAAPTRCASGTARSSRRRTSAASARTRRPPRPCSRTAAAPRRGSRRRIHRHADVEAGRARQSVWPPTSQP